MLQDFHCVVIIFSVILDRKIEIAGQYYADKLAMSKIKQTPK